MADTVRIHGYREFVRACDRAGKETKREVRRTFRKVGEVVRVPWRADLQRFGPRTATGLRTIVRTRGVTVEQTRRKSGNEARQRPNFGPLQQRFGDTVAIQREGQVVREMEHAIDTVADHFDRRS